MKYIFTTLYFSLMLLSNLFGQEKLMPYHFYIYSKAANDAGSFDLELGQYAASNNKLTITDKYATFDELVKALQTHCTKGILFYTHGFQADTKQFEKVTTKFLHDEVFSKITDKYDVILSLKWTSGLEYKNSVQTALSKGTQFMPMVDSIISVLRQSNPQLNVSFVNHSMGNRVFEGIMVEQQNKNIEWHINNVLMYAPDIESNVFFTTLSHLPAQANKCFVFYNIDDRTLAIAKMLKDHNRLGIVGHERKNELPSNVILVNTTGLKDNKGLAANFTLHRYFYTSESIRAQMCEILNEEK
jgi:Alpha/beta hydrolase of unknown function (DUF900)